jgi:hypothetical protein
VLISGISIPIAVLGAEIDKYCPPELLKQFEQFLTAELGVVYDPFLHLCNISMIICQ